MRRTWFGTVAAVTLAAGALAAGQQPAALTPAEVAKLVAKLGSEDFAEREAATRQLEDLGTAAIDELRTATKSDNPEAARRAFDLLRKAERKLANERTLAPTLVELAAKDQPLDDVLADLSKQSKYEVVLGGVKPEDLAAKKVSVSTGGKVAFWSAVLKVCDAAELQLAGVAGFYAPGSIPTTPATPPLGPRNPPRPGGPPMTEPNVPGTGVKASDTNYRRARNPNAAVVLEARDKPRRPAAVHGAILVETVSFPAGAKLDQPTALLQVWPEPQLQWERTTEMKVVKATAADGERLVANSGRPAIPQGEVIGRRGDGVVIVRNPDGSARVVRDTGEFMLPGAFRPNTRQAVVRFKSLEKPAEVARELGVSVFGNVRSGPAPLAVATGLELNKLVKASSKANADLTITCQKNSDEGKYIATVELAYEARAVQPAGVSDDLPGARLGGVAAGNNTVYGIRITDADGKPYTLGLSSGINQVDPTGRVVMKLQLQLHGTKEGLGPPASATFWGTYSRMVEVPVTLKDVTLTGGK